jgi:hypothetical protein
MKVSGHATLAMVSRYLNTNVDTARSAASALDRQRVEREEQKKSGDQSPNPSGSALPAN